MFGRHSGNKVVVVKSGGAMSVFSGLFLFFIVLPVVTVLGCFACVGTAVNQVARNAPAPAAYIPPAETRDASPSATDLVEAENEPERAEVSRTKESSPQPRAPIAATTSKSVVEAEPAPPFEQIRNMMNAQTDAQWNRYGDSLVGKRVSWTGWVDEVDEKLFGGFDLWVDMDSPADIGSVQDVTLPIANDLALKLEKGQRVQVVGIIKYVANILGSCQVSLEKGATVQVVYQQDDPESAEVQQQRKAAEEKEIAKAKRIAFAEKQKGDRAGMRSWTSAVGTSIEAEFVSYVNGKVKLKKADGKTIELPIEKLSAADQQFIRKPKAKPVPTASAD